jgi:ATP-dependent RNA helicase DeaD
VAFNRKTFKVTLPDTLAAPLARALSARGYETLTPVQSAMMAPETEAADLLVSAQTGSGKTVAFGLSIAPTLLEGAERFEGRATAPLALVVAPTRELAMQVRRELEWLYAETGARVASCVGGMDIRQERRALEAGATIVVGTPGRLRDHITRNALDMSGLRAVILDEADEMLDLGFREDLEFILGEAPDERRTLLFSATVSRDIANLAKRFQKDALRITASGEKSQHVDIDYQLMVVPPRERENAIINTLLFFDAQNTIIFSSTREGVRHLTSRLANRGFAVVALSGELSQAERTNALQSMRDGRARVCVATDVAARGIDLPNLDLVIHADLPNNSETLLHRSGRTGRAGRKGTCVVVAPFSRRRAAERLLANGRLSAGLMQAPTAAQIDEKNRQRILDDSVFDEPPVPEEIELLQALLQKHGAEKIAAAYIRRELSLRPPPEDISDTPVTERSRDKDRDRSETRNPDFRAPDFKAERDTRFEGGTWFSVSVGRKQRAEPRWLLPMICKAGGITKQDVGAIRILESESHFTISADAAENFAHAMRKKGTVEGGVTIRPLDAGATPGEDVARSGRPERPGRPARRPKEAAAGAGDKAKPFAGKKPAFKKKPDGAGARKPRKSRD